MSYKFVATVIVYICNFIAVMVSLPCHEFAHAFVAVKNGDMTPKYSGRYTLNPFAHFDLLGLVMMILVRFGWAKPVPVNPNNFRNYKKGLFEVSIAGVTANLILAFLFCPLVILAEKMTFTADSSFPFKYFIYVLPQSFFYLNLGLFVFNLLPFYPLDGFRILDALTKRRGKVYFFLLRYGSYILIGVILIGIIARNFSLPQLDLFSNLVELVSIPFFKFWGLIL